MMTGLSFHFKEHSVLVVFMVFISSDMLGTVQIITLHNACVVHRRCAVQRGMFSTPGDIMITVGDIMSTLGVFSTLGDIMINVGWENN